MVFGFPAKNAEWPFESKKWLKMWMAHLRPQFLIWTSHSAQVPFTSFQHWCNYRIVHMTCWSLDKFSHLTGMNNNLFQLSCSLIWSDLSTAFQYFLVISPGMSSVNYCFSRECAECVTSTHIAGRFQSNFVVIQDWISQHSFEWFN